MAIIFFELPSWPTLVLGIVLAIFTALKGVELYQGKSKKRLTDERDHWKENCTAAQTEANLRDQALLRVRAEKEAAIKEASEYRDKAARLEARTDLGPVIESMQRVTDRIIAWIEEGRDRFDESKVELKAQREVMVNGQRELFSELRSQRTTFEAGFRVYTDEFVNHAREDHESWKEILNMFRVLDARLNHVGVELGIVKWPNETKLTPISADAKIPSSEKPGEHSPETRTRHQGHRPAKS